MGEGQREGDRLWAVSTESVGGGLEPMSPTNCEIVA